MLSTNYMQWSVRRGALREIIAPNQTGGSPKGKRQDGSERMFCADLEETQRGSVCNGFLGTVTFAPGILLYLRACCAWVGIHEPLEVGVKIVILLSDD